MKEELNKVGLKATLPRLKIFKILEEADPHHMSAEEVFKRIQEVGEDVSLATVYRVLAQFEVAGLIKRHNFENGHSVFEIEQGEHHDHMVCIRCGFVQEFVDDIIEARQSAIAANADFMISSHSLTLYGVCKQCKKSGVGTQSGTFKENC